MDDFAVKPCHYFKNNRKKRQGHPVHNYAQWVLEQIFAILAILSAYLRLSEAELSRQFCSLGQSKVLRLLEAPLQRGELVAGIDGSRFADLLWFSVHHAHLGLWLFFHYKSQGKCTDIRETLGKRRRGKNISKNYKSLLMWCIKTHGLSY